MVSTRLWIRRTRRSTTGVGRSWHLGGVEVEQVLLRCGDRGALDGVAHVHPGFQSRIYNTAGAFGDMSDYRAAVEACVVGQIWDCPYYRTGIALRQSRRERALKFFDTTITVPIPLHRELKIGTLQSIIRQSGFGREPFLVQSCNGFTGVALPIDGGWGL